MITAHGWLPPKRWSTTCSLPQAVAAEEALEQIHDAREVLDGASKLVEVMTPYGKEPGRIPVGDRCKSRSHARDSDVPNPLYSRRQIVVGTFIDLPGFPILALQFVSAASDMES